MAEVTCNGVTFSVGSDDVTDLFSKLSRIGFETPSSDVLGYDGEEWVRLGPGVPFSCFDRVVLQDSVRTAPPRPTLPGQLLGRILVGSLSLRKAVRVTEALSIECENESVPIRVDRLTRHTARTLCLRELFLRDALFSRLVGTTTLGLESDATPLSWSKSGYHLTATWHTNGTNKSYPLFVATVHVKGNMGYTFCWEKMLEHHRRFCSAFSASSFASHLCDRGEHLRVIGLRAAELQHRCHLIQKNLAAGLGCVMETVKDKDDSELATRLKQLSSYVHDNAAFTAWLRTKSVVLHGSLFWEKVAGIRFGGLCAAAFVLTRHVKGMCMFEWALSWITASGARGASVPHLKNFFANRQNVKKLHVLALVHIFTDGLMQRACRVTVYEPSTPQTVRNFWHYAAACFARAASAPSQFCTGPQLVRDMFGDEPARGICVQEGDDGVVHASVYHSDNCTSVSSLTWVDEEESLRTIPREFHGEAYKEYLPKVGRPKKDKNGNTLLRQLEFKVPDITDMSDVSLCREMGLRGLIYTMKEIHEYATFPEETLPATFRTILAAAFPKVSARRSRNACMKLVTATFVTSTLEPRLS